MRNHLFFLGLILAPIVVSAGTASPYSGEQARAIKALSDTDVRDYLDGKGMGLAKAAELNHYPGPRHALDLADKLGLTAQQKDRIQAIYDRMQSRAKALGRTIIEKERQLDALFAAGTVDNKRLRALTREIGEHQGELRFVHLEAHLAMRPVLTTEQIALYDRIRGYDQTGATHTHTH